MTFRYALSCAMLTSVSVLALGAPDPALAQEASVFSFDIPAQPLDITLRAIARMSGMEILFERSVVRTLRASAIRGTMPAAAALDRAVRDMPITIERREGSIYVRGSGNRTAESVDGGETILVTGSRIAGSARTSAVITVDAKAMRDAGQQQLGDVVRSIPQNFNGGQNPGVMAGSSNEGDQNVNSATGVNLRGLGADATLTLLNGKRLAYDAVGESVDISAIPLAAVDRLEILTDGASAIYGSDAVAGVVNVILHKDFEGLAASARLAGAWDGGNLERQISLVGGQRWDAGGFMLAADYGQNSAIEVKDRPFIRNMNGGATLLPAQTHYNVLATGHHDLLDNLTFDIDALYNRRTSFTGIAFTQEADFTSSGYAVDSRLESFAISPRLTWRLSPDWTLAASATYGQDSSKLVTSGYQADALSYVGYSDYINALAAGELNLTGGLFSLPGGAAKIAVGGGYRRNTLNSRQWTVMQGATLPGAAFDEARRSTYLFAETELPVVTAMNAVAGLEKLILTGAVRYERYNEIGDIATPKLGLVYAPATSIAFRASWGKSFKAPTLRQTFLTQRAYLELPSSYGATGLPSGATVLQLSGGSGELKPEKAETWSVGATITPVRVPGLRIELNYFHTDYIDRVITPLQGRAGALTNPIYGELVIANPTAAQVDAALAVASQGLQNYTGMPFNAANVLFIVDNRNRNAARQKISGVDITLDYRLKASVGTFGITGNLTYLDSAQQLLPGQDYVQLAGTIYRPPHWRGRAGLTWQAGDVMAATFVNYSGGITDRRTTDVYSSDGMTTVDLNLRYEPRSGALNGVAISASIQNLFNVMPDEVRTSAPYIPPYDSTNYSIVGRSIGITLEKRW
ncbi:Outer membrane receptor for ferrienterochelin and colicins [Sphingobium sp. AP50]|nr:Outer membrane receptor for ferrienterochelin and colicins [Sphingobium sp. AP50]